MEGKYPFHTVPYHAVVPDLTTLPPEARAAVQAVRVGMTRQEFAKTSFQLAHGLGQGALGASYYYRDDGVTLYVTFAASDPAKYQAMARKLSHGQSLTDAEGRLLLVGDPQDTVTAVSGPWVYVPLLPSPKKPSPDTHSSGRPTAP